MDKLDIQLLKLLQKDGRMTVSELSKQLSLSRPSVSERMLRLQEKGIIAGFTAVVPPATLGLRMLLFIQVSELKIPCSQFEQIAKEIESVSECHRVTGAFSYFMKAYVADMDSLTLLVDALVPYGKLTTSIVLSSPVVGRPVHPAAEYIS
ncbi:Lrp/AsnC family transcriptional regulator [Paenibacillus sp. 481]|uniref:Lrp/AsnC family transcriptional regulator n=1 Tax=Paenibacillus sp. 481 TaxID=2835869 RepID=UPI001E55764B|nr:Lrp/AsnC family transcriptional regulator [Paenibacillus sp. 481]UHA76048.1 Lrp/AsnC family transcriptional regulator [Paenibacillus sp. 481]